MKFFDGIQSFFNSMGEYIRNFSYLFLIFVGAFLLLSVVIIIITSFAYECTLTRTIDKINKFLERNPRINDDNLVAFNNLMKARSVPKAFRRQWQQFMLYREHPASYYMSFKHCVENPLRNSSYQQQMGVYKIISYILVALSLVVSVFMSVQSVNANLVLQDIVIIPITILVAYWLISMILDLIHNATSGDLFQNYQYFEINIDKAMLTLPEFVDYEVLFSQEEIKSGIPVLFAYLQKRAVQEQQELEKARIKSVEHEKFDFDKAGLDGSLVLDRAMRETENFSAQRKKYLQEIERVNNEITALENNYKEQVKEYQRQVQTSKETVENLKTQLEQASSTIEMNYIKKQMRDEIDRQQLSEKNFDIATDKYNQSVKSLDQEIKHYNEEIVKAKEALETAMLSEFNTYSVKVYNNLEKIVDEKSQERMDDYKDQIKDLETQLEDKNEELENVYTRYQEVVSQEHDMVQPEPIQNNQEEEQPQVKSGRKKKKQQNIETQTYIEPNNDNNDQQYSQDYNYDDNQQENVDNQNVDNYIPTDENYDNYSQSYDQNYSEADNVNADYENQNYNYDEPSYNEENYNYDDQNYQDYDYNEQDYDDGQNYDYNYDNQDYSNQDNYNEYDNQTNYSSTSDSNDSSSTIPLEDNSNNSQFEYIPLDEELKRKADKPTDDEDSGNEVEKSNDNENTNELKNENVEENAEPVKDEDNKTEDENEVKFKDNDFDFDFYKDQPKTHKDDDFNFDFGDEDQDTEENKQNLEKDDSKEIKNIDKVEQNKQQAVEDNTELDLDNILGFKTDESDSTNEIEQEKYSDELPAPTTIKRGVGRPRKIVDEEEVKEKRKVGRPKKHVEEEEVKVKRKVGRPRKTDSEETEKRSVGRPRKARPVGRPKAKRPVGRPKKQNLNTNRRVGRPRKNTELEVKHKVGRPKKEAQQDLNTKRPVGRPKKQVEQTEVKRPVGRPKKQLTNTETPVQAKKRGRPRKDANQL